MAANSWTDHLPQGAAVTETLVPRIKTNNRDLRDKSADTLNALRLANEPPRLFARAASVVRLDRAENGRPVIAVATDRHLVGEMTRAATFFMVVDKDGRETVIDPPVNIARDLLTRPILELGFPALYSVTETPFIRPDGSVVSQVGYDPTTKIYYAPAEELVGFDVPDFPTADDVDAARALIEEVFEDFPFVDDASKANAYGLMMTPAVRPAISGCTPLGLCDAPQLGTGKTLLAEVVGLVNTGTAALRTAPVRDDEEWRKALTAAIMAGQLLAIFDNVDKVLDSSFLAQAITATVWEDRILGSSKQVTLPQKLVFVVTGNNIVLGGDMPRRCYWIRIDAKSSEPWLNRTFRHSDLRAWVRSNRGRLLGAILTLARAWFAAGSPAPSTPILGSFEEWSRIIGGILAFAGIENFLGNLGDLYKQLDPSKAAWEAFLVAIFERMTAAPFTIADLCAKLTANTLYENGKDSAAFRETIPEELGDMDPLTRFKIRLGKAFHQRAQRRFGNRGIYLSRVIETEDSKEYGVARWAISDRENDEKGAE